MDYIKISEFEIEITKPAPIVEPIKTTYERSFIESQIEQITKQRDALIADKERELKECLDILKAMDDLGIVVKPVEVEREPLPEVIE